MQTEGYGKLFITLSVISVILAAIRALTGAELYLAATQWLIVASVLGLYAIYFKK